MLDYSSTFPTSLSLGIVHFKHTYSYFCNWLKLVQSIFSYMLSGVIMIFSNSYLVTCQYYLRVVRREKCCTWKPQPDFMTLKMLFCVSENADLGIRIITVTHWAPVGNVSNYLFGRSWVTVSKVKQQMVWTKSFGITVHGYIWLQTKIHRKFFN